MSGHSKWHKIKNQKGVADAKRGQLFSKLSKAISVAARSGVDPAMNFSLRLLIEKAKQANMPKDNIERAIARGSGADGAVALQSVLYEVMGPGGAALLVEAVTDNVNRTFASVKTICNKNGGNIDAKVLWQFERKGVVRANAEEIGDRDELEMALIEAGADDIEIDEEIAVYVPLSGLQDAEKVVSAIEGLTVTSAEPEYVATQTVQLSDEDEEKLMNLIEALDEDDDVTNVYTNAE